MQSGSLGRNLQLVSVQGQIVHINIIIFNVTFVTIYQLYYEIFASYSLLEIYLPLCLALVREHPENRIAIQPWHLKSLHHHLLLPQVYFKSLIQCNNYTLIIRIFVNTFILIQHRKIQFLESLYGIDIRKGFKHRGSATMDFSF